MAANSSKARQFSRDAIGVQFDASDARAGLRRFADKIRGEVMLSGVAAGARVLYEEVRQNVPEQTGLLKASIYRYYDKSRSVPGRQIYLIGVNKRTARHWHLIEYGHWRVNQFVQLDSGEWVPTKQRLAKPVWVPAKPYIRPAFDAKIRPAIEAAKARMAEKLKEIT